MHKSIQDILDEVAPNIKYCETFDAYYDIDKDEWLEPKCENYCLICFDRPDRPSMLKKKVDE